MEVKKVDNIIASADKAVHEGNYKGAISMAEPLLKGEKKKTLSPLQEARVHHFVCAAYRFIGEYRTALPHAKRYLELAAQLRGKGSLGHAIALQELGLVETKLKDGKSAKKRFNDALAILKELGMEKSVEYGG